MGKKRPSPLARHNDKRAPKRRRSTSEKSSFCAVEDILFEIFKRLQIKTLIQLRCVCKSWNSIITSTLFITNHYSSPTHQPRLLLLNRSIHGYSFLPYSKDDYPIPNRYRFKPFAFRTSEERNQMIPIDMILGVICLTSKLTEPTSTTILWNPTLHKYITIPRPPPFHHKSWLYSHFLGFGFDNRKHEFKVVRVWMPSKVLPLVYDVLSSNEGGWRRKEIESGKIRPGNVISTSFYMNGNIHWIASAFKINQKEREGKKKRKRRTEYYTLLMFDCLSEEFRAMKLPRAFNRWRDTKDGEASMFEFKGMLSVNIDFPSGREIWGMEEYGVKGKWKRLSQKGTRGICGNLRSDEGMLLMDSKMEQGSYVEEITPIYL